MEPDCDFIHANALSQSSRVLYCSLAEKRNRFAEATFIAWARFYARLPQLPLFDGHKKQQNLTYQAEQCADSSKSSCKARPNLDLHGNHAHSTCKSAALGLHLKHKNLRDTVAAFAKLAGARVDVEPSTMAVLRNALTSEQCRSMFLKHPSKKQKEFICDLLRDVTDASSSSLKIAPEIMRKFEQLEEMRSNHQADCAGHRVDVAIIDEHAYPNSTEMLVDVTSVHPSCVSKLTAELNSTCDREHQVGRDRDSLRTAVT